MKILGYLFFLSFLLLTVPVSAAFAQDDLVIDEDSAIDDAGYDEFMDDEGMYVEEEMPTEDNEVGVLTLRQAKDLIDAAPTAKDAVGGTVPGPDTKYYDMYARQLAFRENAKQLRASLEDRREKFEEPRLTVIENHRTNVEQVYEAETAAYQKELTSEDKEEEFFDEEEQTGDEEKMAEMSDGTEEMPDLKEMPIPTDEEGSEAVKKKVVTTEDAPEFDPSAL